MMSRIPSAVIPATAPFLRIDVRPQAQCNEANLGSGIKALAVTLDKELSRLTRL